MTQPDLNLLHTLDVLLTEGSVARAARKLRLSPSAMSRALARLRTVTGDPLLVRAGRGLVATPRADAMRQSVHRLVEEANALLRTSQDLELTNIRRTFVLRTSDGFAESIGPILVERVARQAPGIRLRFIHKLDKDSTGLREGVIDLETGVVARSIGPEVRATALFEDRYVAVVRMGHPLTLTGITPSAYAQARHVIVWREGLDLGKIDDALAAVDLKREIAATVDGFAAALSLARSTDMIATVPERHTDALRVGMQVLPLPFENPPFTISLLWHPRMDADLAHRWLRRCVQDACAETR